MQYLLVNFFNDFIWFTNLYWHTCITTLFDCSSFHNFLTIILHITFHFGLLSKNFA